MCDKNYLVLLDTDKIHDYIFATNKLKEIRGASAILDNLNLIETREIMQCYRCQEIYLGGGTGKIWFEKYDEALKFCTEIEILYSQKTISSSISTWIEKKRENEVFKDTLDRAEKMLRRKKENRNFTSQVLSNSYFKFCELCGVYPASKKRTVMTVNKLICSSCFLKFKKASERAKIYHVFKETYAKPLNFDENFPVDIEEIGKFCDSRGYIGFIYADGNSMGKLLRKVLDNEPDNDTKLKEFSKAVDNATKQGIIQAILSEIPEPLRIDSLAGAKSIFPFEIIIAGGDDLVVIVPATKALNVALNYMKNFQSIFELQFENQYQLTATVSCGVGITKSNYPINLQFKLAKELLLSAKKLSKLPLRNKEEPVSAIDFSVMTTSSTGDLQQVREKELILQSKLHLTERPYTIDKLEKLIEFAKQCKEFNFPNNKLISLQRSLFKGMNQASLDYLKFIARLKNEKLKNLFKEKLSDFKIIPWKSINNRTNEFSTPFFDFIECYEFVTADIKAQEEEL